MAAEWPAFAVVVLCACAAPLFLLSDGVRADDGVPSSPSSSVTSAAGWCLRKECKCATTESTDDNDRQQRVSVKCHYAGDKNVIWEPDSGNKNLSKSLVSLELNGDGRSKLTVHGRTFATFARLRSFNVSGFAELTVKQHGLLVKNVDLNFTLTIGRVHNVSLNTNAVQPTAGTVDALVEDCHTVRLNNEVVSKLRSFAFRRIESLELSKNTFKNAAEGSAIEKMTLEDLKADRLPSHAFITTIDHLSITNCAFGAIERNAFPINSMINATLTNVTVDRVESEAFQNSSLITNLRIIGCRVREMEKDAVMSVVQSIYIERSEFGSVRTSAVAVANELTLRNNTFGRVASRGFVLHNLHSVRVDGNTFGRLDADAFFESTAAARQTWSVFRMRDNVFLRPPSAADGGAWSTPAVRLQTAAIETDVADNRFAGRCGCGPWRFVTVADDNGTATTAAADDDDDGNGFAELNYCTADDAAAGCANLTADREFRIDEFSVAAGCVDAGAFDRCVKDRTAAANVAASGGGGGGGGFRLLGGAFTPATERGVITTVVLLVLCGFGAVCAVSAVTWLNARGYFIKLRSLLTSNGGGGGGGRGTDGGMACRTMSAHSLSPMSVHEYAELQRYKLGGSGDVGDDGGGGEVGVRVIVYQDKGAQTVPEELTHEMLQTLRDKLDDPEDYAEARGMIEHLYDLIRVEETCCGGGGNRYGSGGLDDMTSTITTKAVAVGPGSGRERPAVRSVGTGTPSLDRLCPSKINVAAPDRGRPPKPPPPPGRRPPSVVEYVDPADLLLYGGRDGDDADIYCELADLRVGDGADGHQRHPPPPPPPPPVPNKPTEV